VCYHNQPCRCRPLSWREMLPLAQTPSTIPQRLRSAQCCPSSSTPSRLDGRGGPTTPMHVHRMHMHLRTASLAVLRHTPCILLHVCPCMCTVCTCAYARSAGPSRGRPSARTRQGRGERLASTFPRRMGDLPPSMTRGQLSSLTGVSPLAPSSLGLEPPLLVRPRSRCTVS
jgi:hypothetical protein